MQFKDARKVASSVRVCIQVGLGKSRKRKETEEEDSSWYLVS